MAKSPSAAANPLLSRTYLPNRALPFDKIGVEHFEPAFTEGMKRHAAEIKAISGNKAPPTFANTIEALEFAGETLGRVSSAFGAFLGA